MQRIILRIRLKNEYIEIEIEIENDCSYLNFICSNLDSVNNNQLKKGFSKNGILFMC